MYCLIIIISLNDFKSPLSKNKLYPFTINEYRTSYLTLTQRKCSNNKNAIPKGNLKQKKKLAELIVTKIEEQRENIFGDNPEFFGFAIEDSDLKKLANSITINPVNSGYFSPYQGRNGIHINYEFDTHNWDENDLNNEIARIIKSKEGGEEDLLLIWADRFELLYQDEDVTEVLREKFAETSFKQVYFLVLFDRIDMFMGSWRIRKIK